jgi:hypothetical protein
VVRGLTKHLLFQPGTRHLRLNQPTAETHLRQSSTGPSGSKVIVETTAFFSTVKLFFVGIVLRFLCLFWMWRTGSSKVLIVVDCLGRLGNRLTVLANVLCYARRTGSLVVDLAFLQTLKNPRPFAASAEHGGILLFSSQGLSASRIEIQLIRFVLRHRAKIEAASVGRPSSRFFGLPLLRACGDFKVTLDESTVQLKEPVVLLTGLDYELPEPTDEERKWARSVLDVRDEVSGQIDEFVGRLPKDALRIGVHIRHGDYRHWCDGKFFFPSEEYARQMQRLEVDLGRPLTFVVVSDEQQSEAVFAGVKSVHVVRGTEEHDLYLLGRMDLILATYSTFAFWSSFHGNVPLVMMGRSQETKHSGEQ